LWVVAGLLAVVFLSAGAMKLALSKDKLAANPNMAWTEQFSPGVIKAIGALEVLAAVGLILPAVLGIVPVLVPLAAVGLVLMVRVGPLGRHSPAARLGKRWPIHLDVPTMGRDGRSARPE
jgi:uncharacterized membrane protein YphA (DoxX/SURF4 family)